MDLRENFVIQPESTICKIVNFLLETRNRKKRKKKKEKRKKKKRGFKLESNEFKKVPLAASFCREKKKVQTEETSSELSITGFHTESQKGQVQAMAVISKDSQDTNSATDPLLSWLWYSLSLCLKHSNKHIIGFVCV